MGKRDYEIGSSKLEDFYGWINQRHRIWIRRAIGQKKPWTDDPIFLDFKFTNAFRYLDRGTVALRGMLAPAIESLEEDYRTGRLETREEEALILWNIIWYRSFNRDVHAEGVGFCNPDELSDYMEKRADAGQKNFTSAHMTAGIAGQSKTTTILDAMYEVWVQRFEILEDCIWGPGKSMQKVFRRLLDIFTIGPFLSYEMVCDLRFTPLLNKAEDINSWSNVGPGAKRGLERLGLVATEATLLDNMIWLHHPDQALQYLERHVKNHYDEDSEFWPPFELREIEHSLCEFDKYERVRLGQGRPRRKYNGRPE